MPKKKHIEKRRERTDIRKFVWTFGCSSLVRSVICSDRRTTIFPCVLQDFVPFGSAARKLKKAKQLQINRQTDSEIKIRLKICELSGVKFSGGGLYGLVLRSIISSINNFSLTHRGFTKLKQIVGVFSNAFDQSK